MPVSIRLITFTLLAGFSSTSGVSAQTVAATATKWGLIGVWQLDCKAPVSQSNGALSFVVRGGKLFHDRDFSGGRSDSSAVMSAIVTPDEMIEFVVFFTSISQSRQQTDLKGSDGRRRTFSNRNVDTNEYTVKDGKFTANGNETPWQTRCR